MNQKRAAIEQLFRQHYVRLRQIANRLLHDDEEGKDVVSDVFTRLIQSDILPAKDKVESYLSASVRNRCLDMIAHQQYKHHQQKLLNRFHIYGFLVFILMVSTAKIKRIFQSYKDWEKNS